MTALLEALPTVTRGRIKYPLVLPRHSAFHTPLMARGGPVRSALCAASLPPAIPLVDGTGRLWPAGDTATLGALRQYTIRETGAHSLPLRPLGRGRHRGPGPRGSRAPRARELIRRCNRPDARMHALAWGDPRTRRRLRRCRRPVGPAPVGYSSLGCSWVLGRMHAPDCLANRVTCAREEEGGYTTAERHYR